jgi:pimeloyl-ACP methyl ester carboxylesterase
MNRVEHPRDQAERAPILMILLPGLGDSAADYARHGMVATAHAGGLDADMVAVDASFHYYARDEIEERLYQEVILPARQEYAEVWLVGISLGGLGAILTTRAHPDAVDGLVLLSPYLGPAHMPKEIEAEGGVRSWKPPPPPAAYDWDVELWTWLKRYEDPQDDLPPLYLAYGRQDQFALGHDLLAEMLPDDHVVVSDGDHYWSTWTGLWERMVSRPLSRLREHPSPRWAMGDLQPPVEPLGLARGPARAL